MNRLFGLAKKMIIISASFFLISCGPDKPTYYGFISADFVYLSPKTSGILENLYVDRGDWVTKKDLIAEFEVFPELKRLEQAKASVDEMNALVSNAEKGMRPAEIDELEARKDLVESELVLAKARLERVENLNALEHASDDEHDVALHNRDSAIARLETLNAQLAIARLAQRDDVLTALNKKLENAQANHELAEWNYDNKKVYSLNDGRVFDVFFYPGEYVRIGQPILSVLRPQYLKTVFYVKQSVADTLKIGQNISVSCDSCAEPVTAIVSFISPEAEFSPPILFDSEHRESLVFQVEAKFKENMIDTFKPGQPVDIDF